MSFPNESPESTPHIDGLKSKEKKPWYRKKRYLLPAALMLVVGLSVANSGTDERSVDTQRPTANETGTSSAQTQEAADSSLTTSQRNAVSKAAEYLRFMAFSRSGLIDQLEFEGFSTADATYGVDAQNANWNEQAAKKAAEYLDVSSFSRSSLIDQLEFEGFSSSEAVYGVTQNGF